MLAKNIFGEGKEFMKVTKIIKCCQKFRNLSQKT